MFFAFSTHACAFDIRMQQKRQSDSATAAQGAQSTAALYWRRPKQQWNMGMTTIFGTHDPRVIESDNDMQKKRQPNNVGAA